MSSHHFVKDKQDAALIIANGEACSADLLNQLLEWNPFVLVLDGAWNRISEMNIRPDAILGDMDSLSDEFHEFIHRNQIRLIETPDQEFTDLQKGIQFLADEGHKSVNVLWATGRRADHNFNNLATLPQFSGIIDVTVIDDFSRIYNLPKQFKKWYPGGTNISLLPIGIAENISTSNLEFNLNNESLHLPARTGSSNRVLNDGFVNITYSKGNLLLMECWDIMP